MARQKHLIIYPISLLMLLRVVYGGSIPSNAPDLPPQDIRKIEESDKTKKSLAKATKSSPKRILDISLKGKISEHQTASPFFFSRKQIDILSIFKAFQKAQKDDSIEGVLIRMGPLSIGWGKCQEIRTIIREFRKSGKKVTVWLPFGSNREYFVASAADTIIMPPAGILLTMGLRAEVTFFKGLFDKLGVEAEIIHVGQYKAAGEPYTRNEMSPQYRETVETMIDGILDTFLEGVSKSRKLALSQTQKILENGPYRTLEAKKLGLIDKVEYLDEYLDKYQEDKGPSLVSLAKYLGRSMERPEFGSITGLLKFLSQITSSPSYYKSKHAKLALIYAIGPILSAGGPDGFPSSENIITAPPMIKALKQAREDDTVKAVVLRVDSPGGDVITSDLIWRAVQRTNEVKPVIVSMSDVAASGGYYISMPARAIVAHKTTITGSIGVVGGKFNLQKLYDLLGLNVDIVERGSGSGLFSVHHKLSEEERIRLYRLLKQTYDLFLEKAAEGRNQKVETLAKAAEGRAWTALKAEEFGLVDEFGGLRTAFNLAKKHAGLNQDDPLELLILPRPKTIFELLGASIENSKSNLIPKLSSAFPSFRFWNHLAIARNLAEKITLFYMPYSVEIK